MSDPGQVGGPCTVGLWQLHSTTRGATLLGYVFFNGKHGLTDSYMGVSKNNGTPKWMVYFMENPIKMDDLGVPLFLETHICKYKYTWSY